MTLPQLQLGIELYNKIHSLKEKRRKYKSNFDEFCELMKIETPQTLFYAQIVASVKFLEGQIILLDKSISYYQNKFDNL